MRVEGGRTRMGRGGGGGGVAVLEKFGGGNSDPAFRLGEGSKNIFLAKI